MRQVSRKRASLKREYEKAKEVAFEFYGHRCVVSLWSQIPCSDVLHPDHVIPLGRGGKYADPNNIWPLCHIDHHLKTHVLVKGAEILGLYGKHFQEIREFEWRAHNPDGDWDEYFASWMRTWDAEKRYMQGGKR